MPTVLLAKTVSRVCAALLGALTIAWFSFSVRADELPKLTSLSNPDIRYTVPERGYHVIQRGDVRAVVIDNRAVSDDVLPDHKAGYSGIASLTHTKRTENLFVPTVAGLNFEHIHDGTTRDRAILFEPRNAPMELRVVDAHTVELYQAPTPTWKLESVLRYQMLDDGTLEMTFECVPREKTFRNGYIGLFWAGYIHQPESKDIHFPGFADGEAMTAPRWVRGITPRHGTEPTHLGRDDQREFQHDADFPLTLVFNRSKLRFDQPWYYGLSHGMAYVQMFRPQDQIRLSQSPSGGGQGNPAWDFQYFIPDYELGRRYQFVMRALYMPFESREQIERVTRPHRKTLGQNVDVTIAERAAFEPTSQYEEIVHRGWPLVVNRRLLKDRSELWDRVRDVLDPQLFQMERVVPAEALTKLKTVRIWIEDFERHHPCMCYHPDKRWLIDNDMNPDKERSVEIANAENFIRWTISQPWMVLHEMAHAYHHQFLDDGYGNADVLKVFRAATDRKLYDAVLRISGRKEKAYAMNNQMEYFAECSEAYFGTNDFYPYVRSELREHDPDMDALLQTLWGPVLTKPKKGDSLRSVGADQ